MKPAYCLTIFLGSLLLFAIQPMVGKILLPSLGGTPAVWNTCVLFFQGSLLLGYGYAHFVSGRLSPVWQVRIHLLLLATVTLALPIQAGMELNPPGESDPTWWLLGQLMILSGLPFIVVSANAPLLQRWFSVADENHSGDPYFLYAFSNAGSLLALLAYPFLLERSFDLAEQTRMWSIGFALLTAGFVVCGWFVFGNCSRAKGLGTTHQTDQFDIATFASRSKPSAAGLTWPQRWHFIFLAAVPSSLMLGVTTVITTDVGSVPLLWVIPLAIYLVTFILAFANRKALPLAWMNRMMPYLVLLMAILLLVNPTSAVWAVVPAHLLTFFVVTMVCHGELSRRRPPVEKLTEFYFLMSLGGVVGGFFNAIVAPHLFDGIIEYPLMLVAACLLRPVESSASITDAAKMASSRIKVIVRELAWPVAIAMYIFVTGMMLVKFGIDNTAVVYGLLFGIPALFCFQAKETRLRFAGIFAAIVFGCGAFSADRNVVEADRGFFGVTRVKVDEVLGQRLLVNGTTVHGIQNLTGDLTEPLSYYHRTGPMGDIFGQLPMDESSRVGVIGLGAGSIASYAKTGQTFDFFEIDPVVCRFASDPDLFCFLSESEGNCRIVVGDARVQLRLQQKAWEQSGSFSRHQLVSNNIGNAATEIKNRVDAPFDLLILDAFSSDAIPTHLMTREAFELYGQRLRANGVLAIHISNSFLDLEPLVAALCDDAGWHSLIRKDVSGRGQNASHAGKTSSIYVALSANSDSLEPLAATGRWKLLRRDRSMEVWTDGCSSLMDVIRWSP